MFTWGSIILAALKLINAIMGAVNREKWMQAGADAEIAKISATILQKTEAGKAIMEKVNALSDEEVDDALRDLEPK
jgi:hypothetical protein